MKSELRKQSGQSTNRPHGNDVPRKRPTKSVHRRRRKAGIRRFVFLLQSGCILLLCSILMLKCNESDAKELAPFTFSDSGKETGSKEESTDTEESIEGTNQEYILEHFSTVYPQQLSKEEAIDKLISYTQMYPEFQQILEQTDKLGERLLIALANNPEMYSFAEGYLLKDENAVTSPAVTISLTRQEKEKDWPLLLQWDKRWGYHSYGASNIGLSGCGPTCLSMVAISLTKDFTYTPDVVADFSMKNGYYVSGVGTSWNLMTDGASFFGLTGREFTIDEELWKQTLNQGNAIICSLGPGDFTANGHFVVIYGYDKNGFLVNDPNSVLRSNVSWPYTKLAKQIKNLWEMKVD